MNRSYRNEYLFSEIYLESITQQPITDENLRASFQTIKEWREFADKTSLEQWITTYIEPVLDTLGFGHHKDSEELLVLFPDVDKSQPMSLCYVVPPGEDINCTLKGKHWAEKIIRNLRKHNFQWGILTDGLYWRIYHTKEPTPYETYVEINLETILSSQDYAAFQIFYFFFRPGNFTRGENGKCKFDIYKEESAKTTEYIEENLRAVIEREKEGEGVLQTLCLGYLNTLNQDTYNEEERVRIYGGAILYLFRLLFLFYSTARSLLKEGRIESFKSIVQDSFRLHNEGGAKSNSYDLWFRLQDLFAEIDLTYDGGLFDSHSKEDLIRFIEETRITDPFLSEVIFGLAYYRKSKRNFVPIEYRDLSVRHLGSLYEGLLEHNLFIAEENTIIRKSGNKIRFIPESKAGKIRRSDTILPKGKVYFSEDAKERKLTGSYYTPEDVVEYIVKNTVDVLLEEKKKELIKEIEPVLKELDSAINESERRRLELFIDDKILKFVEEKILSLSVLDPTMGSGHFLVNATNHIANFIVEILNEYPCLPDRQPGYNSEIDSNPGLWRRRVVEDCIYGVDLNPLAVELAKLCLWITTAFKEKPLSFLNHHLKQGNALVGVRISDLEEYLTKARGTNYDLFMQSYINSIKQAAESYEKKLSKLTEAREDIEKKKEILSELDEELAPYKYLCNLFTHYLLGEIDESDFLWEVESWSSPCEMFTILQGESKKSQKVLASLNSKDFFHWDIEFPDVFYGDNSGFDCVIGNPPYVEQSELNYKPLVRKTEKCGSTYAFLFELSLSILKDIGEYGYIIPMSGISTTRMSPLQELLTGNSKKINIANFAVRPSKIFPGVDMNVSIITGTKGNSSKQQIKTTGYIRWYSNERKRLFESLNYVLCTEFIKNGIFPKLGTEKDRGILSKLSKIKRNISDYVDNESSRIIYYHSGGRYWRKALEKKLSSHYKPLPIVDFAYHPILCALNSSLYYWYWITFSNCYDLVSRDVLDFPINLENIDHHILWQFSELAHNLMKDYEENCEIRLRTKSGKTFEEKNYYPVKSKKIIDEIDNLLGTLYGLDESEIRYICNFESRFRMKDNDL